MSDWLARSQPDGVDHPLRGGVRDDFIVDEDAGTASCPNGVTRRITPKRAVTFGVACRDCSLRRLLTLGLARHGGARGSGLKARLRRVQGLLAVVGAADDTGIGGKNGPRCRLSGF